MSVECNLAFDPFFMPADIEGYIHLWDPDHSCMGFGGRSSRLGLGISTISPLGLSSLASSEALFVPIDDSLQGGIVWDTNAGKNRCLCLALRGF